MSVHEGHWSSWMSFHCYSFRQNQNLVVLSVIVDNPMNSMSILVKYVLFERFFYNFHFLTPKSKQQNITSPLKYLISPYHENEDEILIRKHLPIIKRRLQQNLKKTLRHIIFLRIIDPFSVFVNLQHPATDIVSLLTQLLHLLRPSLKSCEEAQVGNEVADHHCAWQFERVGYVGFEVFFLFLPGVGTAPEVPGPKPYRTSVL